MKRNILVICLIVLSFFSCTDEVLVNDSENFRIIGGWDNSSRTTFVEEDKSIRTHWEMNDRIGLFTENQSNLAYKALSDGISTEFVLSHGEELKYEEGKKVRAYYPHQNFMHEENIVYVDNPTSQSSDRNIPMFLYGEANIVGNELNFAFKHCMSYLKLTINSNDFKSFLDDEWLEHLESIDRETEAIIEITSSEPIAAFCYDLETNEFIPSEQKVISYYCNNMDIESNNSYTYYIAFIPQPAGTCMQVTLKYGKRNYSHASNLLFGKFAPKNGFKAGHIYSVNSIDKVLVDEGQFKALEAFYHATGGDNWTYNENWLSDKPLKEWRGVNGGTENCSYVTALRLGENNLKGNLPEEFAILMDHAKTIYLNDNLLTGNIPEAVKNHPNWNKLGWKMVLQDQRNGGGFDLSNSNLYIDDMEITDLLTDRKGDLYELFAKNELTQIININSNIGHEEFVLSPSRINQFLDFQTKGLGTIIMSESNDIEEFAKEHFSKVERIDWVRSVNNGPFMMEMYSYIFDKSGQLVYFTPYEYWDSDVEGNYVIADNTEILKAEYEFLQSYLGNPDSSHPEFTYNYYESSDYSKDGEVFVIQNATVGKGLDIVLMGDYFVDKDMEPNGIYEQKMREITEIIFSVEPYRSLRNRFNVYGVKVVSPNNSFFGKGRGVMHSVTAFEYAEKVPTECPLVLSIVNLKNISLGRSSCLTFKDGSCFASIIDTFDETIIHELCGHGIGHLRDEYIESGYEQLTIPDSEIEEMEAASLLYKWGYGMNVDYNNDPKTIRWAHLLADERFQNEDLGIYEGATYGYGAYRPSDDSVMNSSAISWFNAPSREAIYKTVMSRSEGDDWEYNYEAFVAFDEVARKSSVSTRSMLKSLSNEEKQRIQERHCPPIFINKTWKEAMKDNNSCIIVPLR